MFAVHSFQNEQPELPSREKLLGLSPSELRQQCEFIGVDARSVDRKDELVAILYNFYHENRNLDDIGKSPQVTELNGPRRSSRKGSIDNEALRIVEDLQQMIIYYGQGDLQSDKAVRDTIRKLPREALEVRDMYGNTLLMLACRSRAHDLVQILISKGTDVNSENSDGATCLHFACYTDSLSVNMAQLLLNNGAKAEVTENQYGCTPLHWAASAGDLMLCRMLCDAGADPTTVDSRGYDPVAYAQQGKSLRCSEYLLEMRRIIQGGSTVERFEDDLEPGWERNIDFQSGQSYYYDTNRGVSLWEDEYYDWLKKVRARRNLNGSFAAADDSKTESLLVSPGALNSNTIRRKAQQTSEHSNDSFQTTALDERPQNLAINEPTDAFLSPMMSPKSGTDSNSVRNAEKYQIEPDETILTVSKHNQQKIQKAEREALMEEEPQSTPQRNDGVSETENTRAALTKEAFEDRLASLQEKMEQQLNEQLRRIENKISAPKQDSNDEKLLKSSEALSEMSARIIKLQTDVSSKEIEILSLRREVASLELKLANIVQSSLSALDKLAEDGWWSPQKVKAAKQELEARPRQLDELQAAKSVLCRKLDAAIKDLEASTEKNSRLEQMVQSLDIALDEERFAKEKSMRLFEQSKKGMEIDREVTKSLEESREREKVNFNRLRSELAAVEEKAEIDKRKLLETIEEKKRELLEEKEKLLKLQAEMEIRQRVVEEEARQQMDGKSNAINIFQSQLNEERMSKIQKDLELSELKHKLEDSLKEKEDAIHEMQDAKKKMREEIDRVQGMQGMINDAKLLMSRNEQLSRELFIETDRRKELHNKFEDMKGRIRVYVRLRPLSQNEVEKKCENVLRREDKRTCIMFPESDDDAVAKTWDFDHIFCGSSSEENTQEAVFQDIRPLVTSAVDGVNVCVFAYGQTGSGKTFTMFGRIGIENAIDNSGKLDDECGLAPRAAAQVFKVLEEKGGSSDTSVCVSMFELYTDVLRDLLASKEDGTLKITLAEHSETGMVEVENTVKAPAKDARELLHIFKKGIASRTTSATKMNADSSRSHLITIIVTSVKNRRTGKVVTGKLTLVDLAGSERVSKSGAAGQQLKEAQSINKSLSALGDVISALTSGSKHIPYRNHPLTMLMSDSLGGNAKTLMFVCCSPANYNRAESICALDFAKRCKDVKNNMPGGNRDMMAEVKSLRVEVARLKKERNDAVKLSGGAAKQLHKAND